MRLGEAVRKYVAAKRSSGMAFDHGAYTLRVLGRLQDGARRSAKCRRT
jgi:hypothetical protein